MSRTERTSAPSSTVRTDSDRRRRRNLADAAAGRPSAGYDGPTRPATRTERFRVVVYLCGAPGADLTAPRRACTEYTDSLGWTVTEVIEDRDGLGPPDVRTGLSQALAHVREHRAGAVLTPWRSMISPLPQEYNEVARRVESSGGFLQVVDDGRTGAR
ncbi:recombinase family protein [Streptomyces clavuligerus]|uniref:Resolvase/invertase-type recombinase catalytic domain-containing protein n=1 Tax=Streptomyces clavuligerus TaxID=1901 RepID=E2PUR7_STRCL|nr:recombinase family protein [Streptomyces clavuligerus]ANW19373.1 hypothetical protein BB341_14670 [Streptomyces clavuligerus]AXU13976.1 recombinase family protein [Streptomyces clavuligerus]EFG07846.1 Hypothetical protein SCLAV_2774 [Streptomyces clavuligerus]MBY6303951.1 recombinase family protein [Streptomyces clavuligerus]QCS06750.1 hypothetical protein CRV15_14645 [Streptomyces clavuligerus]